MSATVKAKSKKKLKKAGTRRERRTSTIHWAEDFGEYKNYPTKYSVKQLNNRLDFVGLEKKLEKCFDTEVSIKGQVQVHHSGTLEVKFESQNLAQEVGILSTIMKDVRVHDWSNSIVQHENGDIILNVGVHFCWEFKDGGSNGHDLLWAYYNFDRREWAFNRS